LINIEIGKEEGVFDLRNIYVKNHIPRLGFDSATSGTACGCPNRSAMLALTQRQPKHTETF